MPDIESINVTDHDGYERLISLDVLKSELAKRDLLIVEASKHNSMDLALRLIGSAATYAAMAQTE